MHKDSKLQVALAPTNPGVPASLRGATKGFTAADVAAPPDVTFAEDFGQLERHPDIMKRAKASGDIIRVESFAGMCNMLRTFLSFAKWATLHGKKLEFYWTNSGACPADYDEVLLQPEKSLWNATLHRRSDLSKKTKIDVRTIYTVFDPGFDYYPEPFGLLRPVPEVVENVRGVLDDLSSSGNERFLAIHVRRTDMDAKYQTADKHYLDWIDRADPTKSMKVYIATDNSAT